MGKLRFEATETSIEPVRATNEKVAALIDVQSRKIAVLAKVRDFRFRVGLMQEHFNENYLESDRYPYMRFEGVFEGEEALDVFEGECFVSGTLKLHGVGRPLRTKTQWSREGDQLLLQVAFTARPADFKIKIPKIVIKKIAEEVEIEGSFRFALAGE
jgi:polyisoprenoid-binding protein YceI